jgi:hypothetical protein
MMIATPALFINLIVVPSAAFAMPFLLFSLVN